MDKEVQNETCNEKNPSFSPVTFFRFFRFFRFFPFRSTAGEKEFFFSFLFFGKKRKRERKNQVFIATAKGRNGKETKKNM